MKRLERLLLLVPVLGVGLWAFLFSLANSEPVALDVVFVRLEPAALSVWLIALSLRGLCRSRAAWRSGVRSVPCRVGGAHRRRRRSRRHCGGTVARAERGVHYHGCR
jgi:hypothetical protein